MSLAFLQSITQLIDFMFSWDTKFAWTSNSVLLWLNNDFTREVWTNNLWYSSETEGFVLEAGAVTSTSPVISFITVIQCSVWNWHFFHFFNHSQWSTYAFTMATFKRWKNTFFHYFGVLQLNTEYFRSWLLQSTPHITIILVHKIVSQWFVPVSIRAQLKAVDKRSHVDNQEALLQLICHCMS